MYVHVAERVDLGRVSRRCFTPYTYLIMPVYKTTKYLVLYSLMLKNILHSGCLFCAWGVSTTSENVNNASVALQNLNLVCWLYFFAVSPQVSIQNVKVCNAYLNETIQMFTNKLLFSDNVLILVILWYQIIGV